MSPSNPFRASLTSNYRGIERPPSTVRQFVSCTPERAPRADIDEAAWSAIYSTISRPLDPPKTGRIAVKVINHYGDEVLKTFSL